MLNDSKRLAIVTGGSSGIGLGVANRLLKAGYQVASWDIQSPPSDSDIFYVECDVSSEDSVRRAYSGLRENFGPCHVLVNNCGLQFMAPFSDYPTEKWRKLMGVMLDGTFFCSREVFPDMVKQKFGRIINVSSIHGKLASPFKAAYVTAKHGVLGLSKVMAVEGAEHGITVNSICPGFVDTPLMRNQVRSQMELNQLSESQVLSDIFLKQQNIKRLTSVDQIADLVMFLVSDSAATITGEGLNVAGGWGMSL